ncbi:MAG: hypothetical protein LBI70_03995 [Rickettsiales bacterium]|jgi:tRNA (guanine-N(7)-)-methyltransferase|nr:hypothetical protein [Rickettsiales bacterium]
MDTAKNLKNFGRTNGRPLGPEARYMLEELLPRYLASVEKMPPRDETNYLEIGFGYGESLAEMASREQWANYFGCEVYRRGIINLLKLMLARRIDNIGIFNGDAQIFLDLVEDRYFNGIFILFPDPWPKRKQQKRRFINIDSLGLLQRKLKVDSPLFFASDSEEYAKSVLETVQNSHLFRQIPKNLEDCCAEPSWWVETKYHRKAKAQNRKVFFLESRAGLSI